MNSPAVPPANANRLVPDDLLKSHSLADYANAKRGTESLSFDCNPEFVEQEEAKQQDHRNDHWRLAMERRSYQFASNQNDREKGPNDYVTDLRVLVPRHRSLSASAALAAC